MRPGAGVLVVAGATGNVGRRVVVLWLAAGGRVVALSRDPDRARRDLAAFSPRVDVLPTPGDLRDARRIAATLPACEALIACTPTAVAVFRPLLALARAASIHRVVVLSSTRRFSRVRDESVGRVRRAEAFARGALPGVIILRPTMIIGGRDANVARVAAFARRWRFVPVIGNGAALIQPVWAHDVAVATLSALRHPPTRGRTYTLAGPEAMTTRAFLAAIARREGLGPRRVLPVPRPLALMGATVLDAVGRPAAASSLRRALEDKAFDITDARRDFDFRPHNLATALRDC